MSLAKRVFTKKTHLEFSNLVTGMYTIIWSTYILYIERNTQKKNTNWEIISLSSMNVDALKLNNKNKKTQ